MKKVKTFLTRVTAFSLATLLACTGVIDSLVGSGAGMVEAQAAPSETVNADTFSWDNALVYFLLTDRFKNGNTSNDHSYGRGLDQNGNVINVSDDRATFHGGDFAGITQAIEDGYFHDLGVNALWISAPYEQIHGYIVGGDGNPSFAHYSYHGYYVLDYTDTDANFGTEEEFQELVDTAHEHGLRVIIDVVLNHAGYNSLYDMNEYGFGVVKDGWDDYYFSMANVNNTDYHSYIDYEADSSAWGNWWGADWVRAGLPGYTQGGGDSYTMSLAGLPDFKTESTATVGIPAFLQKKWKEEGRYDEEVAELKSYLSANGYSMTVTNCISYWLSTWVREYGVDGFRCDTAKHVELSSWRTLHDMCTDALKEWKANNPDKKLDDLDFWMTGECWDHTLSYDGYYTEAKFDSMINFDTTGGGVLSLGTVAGKYEGYAGALNTKDDYNVLSYMSSHDSTLARGDQVYLGSALLLLPGGVQIFYGDETNRGLVEGMDFDGNGGAGHSLRSDMNWEDMDEEVLAHWQKVGTFRSNHIAVGAGTHTTVSATSGVGFTRTYSKNGISDRVAACIGANANTSVTLDVSGVWADGSVVTNYYDNSSATVTNGTVTFNSGANGTILVGDPDGKPLVTISGDAKFKGTQEVTISIKEADYAIVSVDGAKKFIAYDGDTFTIGATAYEGDTVSVSYEATNEKGKISGKTTFYKAYADEDIGGGGGEIEVVKGKVRVKMSDGSAPYLYAWEGASTALAGAWPGTLLTQKDSEGYYYYDLDTTGTYNVIFNGGAGAAQTDDITSLKGEVTFEVASGFGSYKQTGGTVDIDPVNNTITIRVKSSSAPYLYVWSNSTTYNGGFPGKQLTEKDEDGNYVYVLDGVASVNCIVSSGSNQNQSDNITGITGEALITVNNGNYGDIDVEKTAKVESKFALLKKEARGIKNMTSSDYTTASWNALYAYVDDADALVALGEETADATAVTNLYNQIVAAKKALVLAAPTITSAAAGNKVVTGKAAYGATVTVTLNGQTYTAQASEITGVWSVTVSSLSATDIIYATAARDGLSSEKLTYDMAGSHDVALEGTLTVDGSTASLTKSVGSSITLDASASGGSGSYTYKFAVLDVSTGVWTILRDFNSSVTYTYTLADTGVKQFAVTVKDSNGTTVSTNRINVTVSQSAELSSSLLVNGSSSSLTRTVGSSVTMNVSASGGSGSYTYKFALFDVATGAWTIIRDFSSSSTCTYTLSATGLKQLAVTVKDSSGTTVATNRINVSVTQSAALSGSLKVNGSTDALTKTIGSSITLNASAAGGSGSYTYKFAVLDTATGAWTILRDFSSSATYTHTLTGAGAKQFAVTVKDSSGTTVATNRLNVTVKASTVLSGSLKVNGSTAALTKTVGSSITLNASAAGGTGSYTYKFAVLDVATGAWTILRDFSSSATYTYTLTGTGAKQFAVTVKDSSGTTVATNRLSVTVKKSTELAGTLQVNGSTADLTKKVRSSITLEAVATGGSGSYTYKFAVLNTATGEWAILRDFSSSSSYTYTLNYAGEKQFAVTVKDSNGTTVSTNRVTVTVEN